METLVRSCGSNRYAKFHDLRLSYECHAKISSVSGLNVQPLFLADTVKG